MAEAAGRLRVRYNEIHRQHRGESGRARELAVATELLERFLPRKLAVASGEAVATDGSVSAQHDILIYDALETPVFDDANGSVVVPIEGVYAVVEVASSLDTAKLQQDAGKINRIKNMPKASDTAYFRRDFPVLHGFNIYGREFRDFPVLGFSFAYASARLETLGDALSGIDEDIAMEHSVDMICTLDHGCIANGVPAHTTEGEAIFTSWQGCPAPETSRFAIPVDPDSQPGVSLMLLYLLGFGLVAQARTHPIRLVPYMEMQ